MNEWIGQVLPFWKDLTEMKNRCCSPIQHWKNMKKESCFIDGGDCAGVQIVKEGQVRVYITSPSGVEITLYRLVRRCQYPECVLYDKGMDISLDMMMESDTVLYTTRKKFTRN